MGIAARTRQLRRRMVTTARELTVAVGLSGFTVEQLCEQVGVSRRTFFNHFASKEDVVLGIEIGSDDEALDEFAAGGGAPAGTPPLDALIQLIVRQLRNSGVEREEHPLLRAALEREPQLVAKFVVATDKQGERIAAAIRSREGYLANDPRPTLIAELVAALLKASAKEFFDRAEGPPLDEIVLDRLALTKTILT